MRVIVLIYFRGVLIIVFRTPAKLHVNSFFCWIQCRFCFVFIAKGLRFYTWSSNKIKLLSCIWKLLSPLLTDTWTTLWYRNHTDPVYECIPQKLLKLWIMYEFYGFCFPFFFQRVWLKMAYPPWIFFKSSREPTFRNPRRFVSCKVLKNSPTAEEPKPLAAASFQLCLSFKIYYSTKSNGKLEIRDIIYHTTSSLESFKKI